MAPLQQRTSPAIPVSSALAEGRQKGPLGLSLGFVVQRDTAVVREEGSFSTTLLVSPCVSDDSLGSLVPVGPMLFPTLSSRVLIVDLPFHFYLAALLLGLFSLL